jgi:UDP-N-acetylglucosamine 4,6-dehydratase
VLLSEDEARDAVETADMYIVQPRHSWWHKGNWPDARPLPEGFRYTSDTNSQWLTGGELSALMRVNSSNRDASSRALQAKVS